MVCMRSSAVEQVDNMHTVEKLVARQGDLENECMHDTLSGLGLEGMRVALGVAQTVPAIPACILYSSA